MADDSAVKPDTGNGLPQVQVGEAPMAGRRLVSNPMAKFVIAVFAVATSALIPRMLATLGSPTTGGVSLEGFTPAYYEIAVAFALIVGGVLAIFEWRIPRHPRDSFMTALGIPAVLIGAFNTNVLTQQIASIGQQQSEITRNTARALNVPVEEAPTGAAKVLGVQDGATSSTLGALAIISEARAQPLNKAAERGFLRVDNVGITYQGPRYYVVLKKATNAKEAQLEAKKLRRKYPDAAAIQIGNQFLVVDSPQPKNSAYAIEGAAQARANRLTPSLLRVR